jgi:glucose-1-phosphate adenylyltransferase
MRPKKVVAMLLAGGQGSRLGVLTSRTAKPAVPYGGKFRIIDFPLSNLINSDIDTVGVLTQYRPLELNRYIGNGGPWDLNRNEGGAFVLPPYSVGDTGEWYRGTANAIFQNIAFIDRYSPQYVLVLSGDHIYKMDYAAMLKSHIARNADCTIAVLPVPLEEASRFGIMNTDADDRITEFQEKPKNPRSNKASMGIYIFTWPVLKRYLIADEKNPNSHNDFGKDIIPAMLAAGQKLYAYSFSGYWKDVGTILSLWESNMDLLEEPPAFDLFSSDWRIYSRTQSKPGHYIGEGASVTRSVVSEGCTVLGHVTHSVLFTGCTIEEGSVVVDSVIMPNAVIGKNARIFKAIVGENVIVGENCSIGELEPQGEPENDGIAVVGENTIIPPSTHIPKGVMLDTTFDFNA